MAFLDSKVLSWAGGNPLVILQDVSSPDTCWGPQSSCWPWNWISPIISLSEPQFLRQFVPLHLSDLPGHVGAVSPWVNKGRISRKITFLSLQCPRSQCTWKIPSSWRGGDSLKLSCSHNSFLSDAITPDGNTAMDGNTSVSMSWDVDSYSHSFSQLGCIQVFSFSPAFFFPAGIQENFKFCCTA